MPEGTRPLNAAEMAILDCGVMIACRGLPAEDHQDWARQLMHLVPMVTAPDSRVQRIADQLAAVAGFWAEGKDGWPATIFLERAVAEFFRRRAVDSVPSAMMMKEERRR